MSNQITPESYTTLSEDLLIDIQEGFNTGGWGQDLPRADAKGLWTALANSVCYAHGQPQGLVVFVVCDTAATAQQLAQLLNHYSVHAPTTW